MKEEKIVCPYCGREYLPVEIFIPKYVFSKPLEIIRNTAGKIVGYTGDEPDFNETYICDECGSKLNVKMKISFDITNDQNFNNEYESKIPQKQNKVSLF